ncbi:hypothetical protein IV203_017130 [Nitzschia inconspicua]|uniref:Uncharacterized protein n=1 Tax=Nitzschia inconspicua TaxID=303405 RepID=A0A9K3KRD0_9STRA|nr:hypothetical protein IV203_017130 [Nitzschia inconspicua]
MMKPFRFTATTTRLPRRMFQSSSTLSNRSPLSRYGLGGQSWKRFNPESYQELIFEALSKNVTYLEIAGQDGGDIAMVGAIQSALERNPEFLNSPVTITSRIGYRSLSEIAGSKNDGDATSNVSSGHEVNGASTPLTSSRPGDVALAEDTNTQKSSYVTPSNVVHNISSDYVLETIQASPLMELQQEMKNLKLVFLLHNPEAQVVDLLNDDPNATVEERQEFIQQRWTPAMDALEEYGKEESNPKAYTFGVVSNGLGIPSEKDHPMHLDASLVIAASKKYQQFSTVELPANLLETYGWGVARKIKSEASDVCVSAIRPLTCYPCLGTTSGFPFRLVDYALPALEDKSIGTFESTSSDRYRYTNDMSGIPAIYQMALQAAMAHFDAEELLEIKQERDLSMEERETLDGCKLMQSMIHDLDNDLAKVRSFAAHEDELYGRIIPLIYDTFELMDDKTSDVLQAYFAAYAVAVRYAIAKKTREVLKEGEDGSGTGVTYPQIPDSMTLQEFALRQMLAEKAFDRIVIGASTMQDFHHQVHIMETVGSEENPLKAIDALVAEETRENAKKDGDLIENEEK